MEKLMVTFRCKRSKNTVSFNSEADIEIMRKDENYEEIIENAMQIEETSEAPAAQVVENQKRRGRPHKIAVKDIADEVI